MRVVAIVVVLLIVVGFGYLGSTGAVKKGYPRGPFWALACFFLLPTMIGIIFLPDRTKPKPPNE